MKSFYSALTLFLAFNLFVNNLFGFISIKYDTIVSGAIDVKEKIDTFSFSGAVGDIVTLRILPASCGFDTHVEIIGPNDTIWLTKENPSDGCYSYNDRDNRVDFENIKLPSTGKYTVFINDIGGDETSNYTLTLQCRQLVLSKAKAIAYDTDFVDAISPLVNTDAYTFDGKEGDIVTLRVLPASCGFDTHVEIIGPNDTIWLTKENPSDGCYSYNDLDNRVDFENIKLPSTGKYTVFINDIGGDETSNYTLTLQCRQLVLSKAKAIAYDTVFVDAISPLVNTDAYTFDGKEGDIVTLRVLPASCGFDAHVEIIAPNDTIWQTKENSSDGCYSYNDRDNRVDFEKIKLPSTGKYTVFINDIGGDETSNYTLTLQCRQQVLSEAKGIAYDTVFVDAISPLVNTDAYTFNGKEGDIVTLRVLPASCGFDAHVEIIAPNDTIWQTKENSSDGCYSYNDRDNRVDFENIKLPSTGKYTVFINDMWGDETSNYTLSLQCRQQVLSEADTLTTRSGKVLKNVNKIGKLKAYVFLVNKDDTTSLKIIRKTGSVEPYIQLFGPSDSLILTTAHSTQLIVSDQNFTSSGRYILIVGDYNGDATGSFELTWDGIVTNLIQITNILQPDSIIAVNKAVIPRIIVTNIGWEKQNFTAGCRIFNICSDTISGLSLDPFKSDTLEFKTWTPVEAATYIANFSTNFNNFISNRKTKTVAVSKGVGPEIYARNPESGKNGGLFTMEIKGKGFQPKTKAILFNSDFPVLVADSTKTKWINDRQMNVTFNLADVPESVFHLKVINPNGQESIFYEAFVVNQFNGKELEFNKWQDVIVPPNSQRLYGINVPDNTFNLFFLVRKSTKIGHHGTWTGNIRVFRQGKLICEKGGMEDFDLQIKNAEGGRYYVEVWANDDAQAQVKVCDHLDVLYPGEWHKGLVLKGWGHDWTQINIPANTDTLFFETQGFGVYSNMHIYYDSLTNKTDHWYFDKYQQGYHLTGKILKPKAGRYLFKYEDSDNVVGGKSQERDYLLNVDARPIADPENVAPEITQISTYKLGILNPVTIQIKGKGFDSNALVRLIREDTIVVNSISVKNFELGQRIDATFMLSAVNAGAWKLEVRNPNGNFDRTTDSLIVENIGFAKLELEIIGRDEFRIGRQTQYWLRYRNSGNIDAPYVYISASVWDLNKTKSGINLSSLSNFTRAEDEKCRKQREIIERYRRGYFYARDILFACKNDFNCMRREQRNVDEARKEFYLELERWPKDCDDKPGDLPPEDGEGPTGRTDKEENSLPPGGGNEISMPINNPYLTCYLMTGTGGILATPRPGLKNVEINKTHIDAQALKFISGANDYSEMEDPFASKIACGVGSSTPEDKYGTTGFGANGQIAKNQDITYKIDFWNHEKATAPAQQVFIKDTLDVDLNDTTLAFTQFGFLRWKVPLYAGTYFNVNVDMRPDMNLIVNAVGKYNYKKRELSCTFTSLDPVTMQLTDEPLLGFLPPIDSTGYQIGWVEYKIEPNKNLPDGAKITNRAWVNFDGVGPTNPAPKEAPWSNMIDDTPPESFVIDTLPLVVYADSVLVSWQGTDTGSGIKNYTIYFSENNIDFTPWLTDFTGDSAYFFGKNGKTYYFYSISTDNVGLTEPQKKDFEAMVTFNFTTGINDVSNKPGDGDIFIYPNPAECCFKVVSMLNCTSAKTIDVFNSMGKRILQKQFDSTEITIDLSNQAKGIYFVTVTCGKKQVSKKIIIN